MATLALLCVTRDAARLAQLERALAPLRSHFAILTAADGAGAAASLAACGLPLALVVCTADQLTELASLRAAHPASRLLLAEGDEAAVRQGAIEQATQYVIGAPEADLLDYARVLDQTRLLKAQVDRKLAEYRVGFMDYTRYSDEAISRQVIEGLYAFFAGRDEGHACRRYVPGHVLTREGERNDFLWFIASGEVVLRKRDADGQEQEVVRYRAGGLVGGMSFVTGEPAFTTGVTLTETEVIKLGKRQFAQVMQAQSDLLPAFTNLLLRHFNRRLQNSIRTKMQLQQTLRSLDDAYRQLVENEKMVMLGQLVAGVAHELNNPVSAILRASETLAALIPDLVAQEGSAEHKALGNHTLRQSMQMTPLSTSALRERAHGAEPRFGDRQQARQAVLLQLDDESSWQQWFAAASPAQRAQLLAELEAFQQAGSFLRNISVCARRIGDLVRSLKQYARQDSQAPSWCDLLEGLEDTLVIFENRLKPHEVIREYQPLPKVRGYPSALQQVWTNLIANALDAMSAPGRLTVRAQPLGEQEVAIEIEDSGSGIAPERLAHIFELNYTTKREGHFGLGIGLSICQQVIQQHQGRIEVASEPGRGTRMRVCLPLTGPAPLLKEET